MSWSFDDHKKAQDQAWKDLEGAKTAIEALANDNVVSLPVGTYGRILRQAILELNDKIEKLK